VKSLKLTDGPVTKRTEVVLTFDCKGRTRFGEKFTVVLMP